jgi:anti-sigma regulatory factor (Ser/Thr protein kinase)
VYAKTTLPALAMSPGVARRWARDVLTVELSPVQSLAPLLDVARERTEVIVSELVTNAIVHARSDMTLALTVAASEADHLQIKVEVTDGDSRLPRFDPVDDQALGGRGLQLVRALSDDVGHDVTDFGKTVWAQFALTLPALPAAPVQRARVAT